MSRTLEVFRAAIALQVANAELPTITAVELAATTWRETESRLAQEDAPSLGTVPLPFKPRDFIRPRSCEETLPHLVADPISFLTAG